ncbi:hypothetical protein Tco_1134840 [Tanacetum coccineum]
MKSYHHHSFSDSARLLSVSGDILFIPSRLSRNSNLFLVMTSNNVYFIASFIPLIMEYLVKIDQKARIMEFKRRYFEDYCSDIQYAVSIKEDTAYLCLDSPKTTKETRSNTPIWYNEDVHDLRSVENEFPAIVFNDSLTSNEKISCKPTVSSLNDEIDFRISFDESDDEDYTPVFPSPEPLVSCIDDLDFFKDFDNEVPTIVYNDALTFESKFSTEPTLCPQHIDKFDLKDETSSFEYDEVEQSVLYFNDLFPFNIVYLDNLKSDKGNEDNEIDMIQSSGLLTHISISEDDLVMGSPGVGGKVSRHTFTYYIPFVPEPGLSEFFSSLDDEREDCEEDPEEDPADYPADRGDDDDD